MLLSKLIKQYADIRYVSVAEIRQPLRKLEPKKRTIDSFRDEEVHTYFRFRSKEQLRRLLVGFRFPKYMLTKDGHRFTSEEVMLIGLYRLHRPTTLSDAAFVEMFGITKMFGDYG